MEAVIVAKVGTNSILMPMVLLSNIKLEHASEHACSISRWGTAVVSLNKEFNLKCTTKYQVV